MQGRSNTSIKAVPTILAIMLTAGLGVHVAEANPAAVRQIKKKTTEAMENFDLLEYEEAKRLLNEAKMLAKRKRIEKDSTMAQVHLSLGIVFFSGFQDEESAKLEFMSAVEIDPGIAIDAAYRTPDMEALLSSAKEEFGSSRRGEETRDRGAGGAVTPDVDCNGLVGIEHDLVESGTAAAPKKITAFVGKGLKASKVALFYRAKGEADFTEVRMSRSGECGYIGVIPASALRGDFLHYYVTAIGRRGRTLANKGSSGSPNIIEVQGGSDSEVLVEDIENPLSSNGTSTRNDDGGGLTSSAPGASGPNKLYISLAVGSGGGYVKGDTEQVMRPVNCCFAPALLHIFPELGYFISKQTSVGLAFRMGFPIGANRPGHSPGAPSGMLRVRHALAQDGTGLMVSGAAGLGVIRHTIKLSANDGMGDTDTTGSGPLIAGAGVGYLRSLGGAVMLNFELNTLLGVPAFPFEGICAEDGCSFAAQVDVNLALQFAF